MNEKEIKKSIKESMQIYERRMQGETDLWSATTACKVCGTAWMWGVEDNLNFVCDDCKNEGGIDDVVGVGDQKEPNDNA